MLDKLQKVRHGILPLLICVLVSSATAQGNSGLFKDWKTDTSRRSIDLAELMSGGPPKDGIPAIDEPAFISSSEASWLSPREPVVVVAIEDEARAYPLQILTWHEIVNDEIRGIPVAVTFCPLCYAAVAYDRRIEGEVLTFGVSGMLRHSDMVMYDRQTETLWQQLNGEGIVGEYTGVELRVLPAQIISFEQFSSAYPSGQVLSRDTGHRRDYGRNPYVGYDNIEERPFLFRGPYDDRVPPMEKLVTVNWEGEEKAYPHSITRKERVVYDELGGQDIVVFHAEGAVSALDDAVIRDSKQIGSTGVFLRTVDGQTLTFSYNKGRFVDQETESTWNIAGRAIAGPLSGRQLTPLPHGNFFAFAWFAFKPQTPLYR